MKSATLHTLRWLSCDLRLTDNPALVRWNIRQMVDPSNVSGPSNSKTD